MRKWGWEWGAARPAQPTRQRGVPDLPARRVGPRGRGGVVYGQREVDHPAHDLYVR